MKDLRGYEGKKLVSFLRQGDFSHPGEEKAIEIVLNRYHIDHNHTVLDVGCGLGGTVDYIHKRYGCYVFGLDIETEAISYAKAKYHNNYHFYTGDVVNSHEIIKGITFDFMCAFNSFYAFTNQSAALQSLAIIAHKNTNLAIFDYSDLTKNKEKNPLYRSKSGIHSPFTPIRLDTIGKLLSNNGWCLKQLVDISDKYQKWYGELLEKLKKNEEHILNNNGKEVFVKAKTTYTSIYKSLVNKTSGGVIVHAKKN